jgi:hypothetical protein
LANSLPSVLKHGAGRFVGLLILAHFVAYLRHFTRNQPPRFAYASTLLGCQCAMGMFVFLLRHDAIIVKPKNLAILVTAAKNFVRFFGRIAIGI